MVHTRKHQSHIMMKKSYFSEWQCGISSVHNSHVFPMTAVHENMTVLSEESVPLSRRACADAFTAFTRASRGNGISGA